ncbi:MAG TPA: universal stress protein, partial [Saprospiraceae bacterium]|nr:universal stress protein [Saprospiraceae bacterium]
MKKILVPTDFSKCAGSAMKYALDMAKETGAEIISLHLVSPYEGVDVDGSGLLWIKEYQEAKAKSLVNWTNKFHRMPAYKSLKIKPVCNIGFTVTEIAEMAKEENVDLIVMGTTGASGVEGMLFGSIAGGVISVSK